MVYGRASNRHANLDLACTGVEGSDPLEMDEISAEVNAIAEALSARREAKAARSSPDRYGSASGVLTQPKS